jgi:hypothetical protein
LARKFVLDREIALIESVNKELIQSFTGEEIHHYSVSAEHTQAHRIYGEAIQKTWAPPTKLNGQVKYTEESESSTQVGADKRYASEFYFLTRELQDRNVRPQMGDYLEHGEIFYQITSVTQPSLIFGQIGEKIVTLCKTVPAREGDFQAGSDSREDVHHTHPVQRPAATNR